MKHIFIDKNSDFTLLLLHGTGGDEYDLLALADQVLSSANILSVRGRVSENGMNRFFKRTALNVFDYESIKTETEYLYNFINQSIVKYNLNKEKIIVLGYSNGANIAVNLMLKFGNLFFASVLLHAMIIDTQKNQSQINTHILLTSGINDPIISQTDSQKLYDLLKELTSNITHNSYESGHRISQTEVVDVKNWLSNLLNK